MFKKILLTVCLLFSLTASGDARSLHDFQDLADQNGHSIDKPVIKPQYLPEFDVNNRATAEAATESVIYKAIDIILLVSGIIAVLVIIIGGFMYVVNSGVDTIQTKAKDTILYGVIGLIAIFLSYALVENTIRYLYDELDRNNYEQINPLPQTELVPEPLPSQSADTGEPIEAPSQTTPDTTENQDNNQEDSGVQVPGYDVNVY